MTSYALFADPNTMPSEVACDVCGAECAVEHAVACYRPWTRGRARWDRATCPRGSAEWHDTVERMRCEADATASARVRRLIDQDIEEILTAQGLRSAPAP